MKTNNYIKSVSEKNCVPFVEVPMESSNIFKITMTAHVKST